MQDPACEAQLSWAGWGFIPIRSLAVSEPPRRSLPLAISTISALLERKDLLNEDLAIECDDAVAQRLTGAMWQRALELARAGRLAWELPGDVADLGHALPARAVVEVLAAVVATGFEYNPKARNLERRSSLGRLWFQLGRVGRMLGKQAVKIAERATSARGERVVCMEYATAMRVLFFALKRSTGAPANASVPAIYGRAFDADYRYSHAWNWLVDSSTGSILALDATRVARAAGPALHHEIDPAKYWNVSAFLGSVYGAACGIDPVVSHAEVGELLRATVEPGTYHGDMLLYHLAHHAVVRVNVRERIRAHLAASEFGRLVPDWEKRLVRRNRELGRLGRMLMAGDSEPSPFEALDLQAAR